MSQLDVVVELNPSDPCLGQLKALDSHHQTLSSSYFGGGDTVTVLMSISAGLIPALVKIINASIAARRHISVKVDNMEITGVSEATLIKLLNSRLSKAP